MDSVSDYLTEEKDSEIYLVKFAEVMINDEDISSKHGIELYSEQKVKESLALNKMIHDNP